MLVVGIEVYYGKEAAYMIRVSQSTVRKKMATGTFTYNA